ncbi:glucose-1-phosphate thymidylyltransferase RfbA [Catellatospora methionotrophica]|uniref:glucose-1-phosphate thymidylyltransferase RfbA n=1 Tax=Catellatospora methionotrophica TaxID=121620 RepID=UPI0033F5C9D0
MVRGAAVKGIVLAGGTGSRLSPTTLAVSKHLLPVGDKPMIYYPLSVLMLAGIKDILVVTRSIDLPGFRRLLGDGAHLGIRISYALQNVPEGIAHALTIASGFIGDQSVALVLGDNIFHGSGFSALVERHAKSVRGCVLFGYPVTDPERYGVGVTDADGRLVALEEKPTAPRSNRAITGLYFYDNQVVRIAQGVNRSARGEFEITDVNREYMRLEQATLVDLGRGFAWLDTGTADSLLEASQYVRTLEHRQGIRIACLEEIAVRKGYISLAEFARLGEQLASSAYGAYICELAKELDRSGGCGDAG